MTPEGRVKKDIRKVLDSLNAWYYMPVSRGMGVMGIPDFIGCLSGRFFAIEAKANGGKPTLRQTLIMGAIRRAGGLVFIIDESNVEGLARLMEV
jgi:hypothetical protein